MRAERPTHYPPRALRPTLEAFTLHFGLHGFFEAVALPSTLVFSAFVLDLGIQQEKMGFLASAVSLATLAQLASFPLLRCVRDRRRAILWLASGEPLVLGGALAAVGIVTVLRNAALKVVGLEMGQFHLLYALCMVLTMFCSFGGLLLPGSPGGGRPALRESLRLPRRVAPAAIDSPATRHGA